MGRLCLGCGEAWGSIVGEGEEVAAPGHHHGQVQPLREQGTRQEHGGRVCLGCGEAWGSVVEEGEEVRQWA